MERRECTPKLPWTTRGICLCRKHRAPQNAAQRGTQATKTTRPPWTPLMGHARVKCNILPIVDTLDQHDAFVPKHILSVQALACGRIRPTTVLGPTQPRRSALIKTAKHAPSRQINMTNFTRRPNCAFPIVSHLDTGAAHRLSFPPSATSKNQWRLTVNSPQDPMESFTMQSSGRPTAYLWVCSSMIQTRKGPG